jgi:hypothetical protein
MQIEAPFVRAVKFTLIGERFGPGKGSFEIRMRECGFWCEH